MPKHKININKKLIRPWPINKFSMWKIKYEFDIIIIEYGEKEAHTNGIVKNHEKNMSESLQSISISGGIMEKEL